MPEATYSFPQDFLWGTATAGYQVEGQSTHTDFWQWEQKAGRIAQGQKSGRACDWWDGQLRWLSPRSASASPAHPATSVVIQFNAWEAMILPAVRRTGARCVVSMDGGRSTAPH